MLNQRGKRILRVGEALGHRVCYITGIPFTSGRAFRKIPHQLLVALKSKIQLPRVKAESTATIVWNYLSDKETTPLFWNSFPFHPMIGRKKVREEKYVSTLTTEYARDSRCRILSLDGGGAKGFYSLGVLKEIEAMLNCPLHKRFDIIFGTSTGAIIATLIALGYEVDEIHSLYKEHVPKVMSCRTRRGRTAALKSLAHEVFKEKTFADVKTGIGVVTTKWMSERPMIFKGHVNQAHGSIGTFAPGFGVLIADAVQASCSAFPFFERTVVTTSEGDKVELLDGGYCANNPTLYAIADAVAALKKVRTDLRVVSVGVGVYPDPNKWYMKIIKRIPFNSIELLQKTLEINTQSMDQLRTILFKDVPSIRISDTFERPEMATDLMEHNLNKLNILRQRGRESFASREDQLKEFLM